MVLKLICNWKTKTEFRCVFWTEVCMVIVEQWPEAKLTEPNCSSLSPALRQTGLVESMFLNKPPPPIKALFGYSWEKAGTTPHYQERGLIFVIVIFTSRRVRRLLTTLCPTPIEEWNGQEWPPCLSLFICLCWFISLCAAALFACSLLDSLPPPGIEWPRCPSPKYTPMFT